MASAALFFFILKLLISFAQQSLEFEPKLKLTNESQATLGGEDRSEFMPGKENGSNSDAVLHRSATDGYFWLKNTSDPSQYPDGEQAEGLDSKNLTSSDSGDNETHVLSKGIVEENIVVGLSWHAEPVFHIQDTGPGLVRYPLLYMFLKQEEKLTLPCRTFTEYTKKIMWTTPVKDLSVNVSVSLNASNQTGGDMYIDTESYSLVVPSVEAKHSGQYECRPNNALSHIIDEGQKVFVCSDLEDAHVLFSLGNSANLVCGAEINVSTAEGTFYGHLWQLEEQLSLRPEHMSTYEDWLERKRLSHNQFSLTISNLTLNDSGGLYLCRIWGYTKLWERNPFCYDRKIHLLHKHPFGIESTFYRVYSSLMACGLLGMICAVICVHLRARGRGQTSLERLRRTAEPPGRPTREGEQNGGDPEYDDVDTAIDIKE